MNQRRTHRRVTRTIAVAGPQSGQLIIKRATDGIDADAGSRLTLTLLVFEVMHNGVAVTRFYRLIGVEIIGEEDTDAFAPRIAATHVDDSVSVSTGLCVYNVSAYTYTSKL